MLKSIPFYASLLKDGTTNEVLLYGLIENLSFTEGYCYASSKYLADILGLAQGTIRNLLSSINKKGWIKVDVNDANHRVSIVPLLNPKAIPSCGKPVEKSVEKPVENQEMLSSYNDTPRNSTMTGPSFYSDANNRGDNRGGNIISNNIERIKEINKEKSTDNEALALAGDGPASASCYNENDPARPDRGNYSSTKEYLDALGAYYKLKGGKNMGNTWQLNELAKSNLPTGN